MIGFSPPRTTEKISMSKIIVWSGPGCIYCEQAKGLLQSKGLEYEERKLGSGWTKEQLFQDIPSARTIPQIVVDGKVIGGLDGLKQYLKIHS